MNKEVEALIEYQKVIAEANPGGYQPIRFTKIKYKKSPFTHIDIRMFQRGYDDDGDEVYFPTKRGLRFPEREFRKVVREYVLTPDTYIHPLIAKKCFPLLHGEQYDSAIMQAFKLIEITIREKISVAADEYGLSLIRKAFHTTKGQLTDYDLPTAEREAFSNYIAGAYGYYKNPCSHRDVEMDMIAAFKRLVVASCLLNIVETAPLSDP